MSSAAAVLIHALVASTYLDCGIPANGFARVHCSGCGRDELVAFSGVDAVEHQRAGWRIETSGRTSSARCMAVSAMRRPPHEGAELLRRVFEIDVLECPWCGGKRKLIALLTDGKVVRGILDHLGLPTAAPVLAPARSPPELEFAG